MSHTQLLAYVRRILHFLDFSSSSINNFSAIFLKIHCCSRVWVVHDRHFFHLPPVAPLWAEGPTTLVARGSTPRVEIRACFTLRTLLLAAPFAGGTQRIQARKCVRSLTRHLASTCCSARKTDLLCGRSINAPLCSVSLCRLVGLESTHT